MPQTSSPAPSAGLQPRRFDPPEGVPEVVRDRDHVVVHLRGAHRLRPGLFHPGRSRRRRGGRRAPPRPPRRGSSGRSSRRARPRSRRAGPTRGSPPRLDPAARAEDDPRADRRALGDLGARVDVHAGAGRLDPRLDDPFEDVPGRLQVALRGADVHPVAVEAAPRTRPSPARRGKTSRSIETFSPGGISSRTERSSAYIPAFTSPGACLSGLLQEGEHLAVLVGADQPVGGGVRRPRAARSSPGRRAPRAPRSGRSGRGR